MSGTPPPAQPAAAAGATSPAPAPAKKPVVQNWDKNAPLTDSQNEAIIELGKIASTRPIPQKLLEDEAAEKGGLLEEEIENMQQFYAWFDDLGAEMVEEEKYSTRIETLNLYRDYCDHILDEIQHSFDFLTDLENKYNLVSRKTGELHSACEALVQEQARLVQFADSLEGKLAYFNELPKISQRLSLPSLSVNDESFAALLGRLDECIDFVSKNPDFKDAENYLTKYRALQTRALGLIRNEIVNLLKTTTAKILQTKAQENPQPSRVSLSNSITLGSVDLDTSGMETLYYVRFRTIAPKLRPLCEQIEKRAKIREAALLLGDCDACYFQQRRLLLGALVSTTINRLCMQASNDFCSTARAGCFYLSQICQNEYQLYQHFFVATNAGLNALLDSFSSTLYDGFRPIYIRTHDINKLVDLVYMLRVEILGDQLDARGKSVDALRPVVYRMLTDVQERIAFLAQAYIRDDVAGYSPSTNSLNFPDRLREDANAIASPVRPRATPEQEDASPLLTFKSLHPSWFPTLERVLMLLSKLHANVDSRVFEEIATEAVAACVDSLIAASKQIARKNPLDGQLFLIKHLVTLKEQLTPFDGNFSTTEHTLDFSIFADAIRKVVANPASVFTFSRQNSLIGVVLQAVPQVETHSTDSKKRLDSEIKTSTEAFVLTVSKTIAEPLLSFVTRANAFLNVNKKETVSLRTQSFGTPEKIRDLCADLRRNMVEKLMPFMDKMRLYLASNASVQHLVLNLIKDDVLRHTSELRSLLRREYTEEDRTLIGLPEHEAMYAILDQHMLRPDARSAQASIEALPAVMVPDEDLDEPRSSAGTPLTLSRPELATELPAEVPASDTPSAAPPSDENTRWNHDEDGAALDAVPPTSFSGFGADRPGASASASAAAPVQPANTPSPPASLRTSDAEQATPTRPMRPMTVQEL